MKILVCVKQVCDQADTVTVGCQSGWFEYGKGTVFRMNRYDEYAVEEALRIRERFPDTHIDALSVGPPRVQETIRRALGMGADHGIHISLEEDGYISPFTRAWLISETARGRGYDLILTGVMAEDDMESQVGGLTASMLDYACATGVIFQDVSPESSGVSVEREIEGGQRECLAIRLPAVLTIQSGINIPRYPVLSHMLRAKTAGLECIDVQALPMPDLHQTLMGIAPADSGGTGEFIEGTSGDKARRLLDILHEHSLI